MTKSELIEAIATKHPALPGHGVETAINVVFDAITAELAKDGRVEIRGFGSFSARHRRARQGRNPKTGASIAVPPKRVPFFVTGQELARRVDEGRLKYLSNNGVEAREPAS
jgi:integration host factor subunit beta